FQRYCDSDNPNIIGPEGSQQFFQDLDLSIESVMVIALAWKMNMSTMGYITKDEWILYFLGKKVASVLWTMLLSEQYPLVNHFRHPLMQEKKPVRVINRDQWLNFYEFVTTVSDGLQDYDETSAWPVLFDEFVEWKREKQSF
ncbi:Cullin binding-domain-containing protein, partial [Radiomyces spectabilis]|uniref:Cullin binding-domain-containing protein n=1 Tax=Radiomyces spectabilis TaxID=64574 RepID=UPI002220E0CE